MNIKFALLLAFVLTSLNVNASPLMLQSPDIVASAVFQNEIEVIIEDASYTSGDTYTINVYRFGTLYSSETTDSRQTMVNVPNFWFGGLTVEVEKHAVSGRVPGSAARFDLIAKEVVWPGAPQAIVVFEGF